MVLYVFFLAGWMQSVSEAYSQTMCRTWTQIATTGAATSLRQFRQKADKRQTKGRQAQKFRQNSDKRQTRQKSSEKCVKKFKIGWPPMVWLVGQICWWRQRTEEREGGNTSGSCLAGPACQSGNCLAGSAGQFVGSASQMSNSMASHTKYSKSVPSWIASLYGPFSSLPTLLQFSQCSLPSICGGPPFWS